MLHLPFQPLTQGWIRDQFEAMASPRHLADMTAKFSTDLAYTFGTSRYRVNAAQDAHGYTMMLRKLPSKIPTFAELGAPEAIRSFAHLERGLVLVTGPTGSGKSTTLAAMLNEVITTSSRHVITLEDPIEFRFPTDKASLVNQRELGESFVSFEGALRDALRQDPDVILVGEMRDGATIKAALTAAETGHLVFGTLHSINAGPDDCPRRELVRLRRAGRGARPAGHDAQRCDLPVPAPPGRRVGAGGCVRDHGVQPGHRHKPAPPGRREPDQADDADLSQGRHGHHRDGAGVAGGTAAWSARTRQSSGPRTSTSSPGQLAYLGTKH